MSSIENFKTYLDSALNSGELIWTKSVPVFISKFSKNSYLWLTKPYELSKHFQLLIPSDKNYEFRLEQESWVENLEKNSEKIFERWSTHRANLNHSDSNILAWGCVQIPEPTYQAYQEQFGDLKNKPIGQTLLFNNPEVIRGAFEYANLKINQNNYWARRSCFYWQGLPLWVIEIFNFSNFSSGRIQDSPLHFSKEGLPAAERQDLGWEYPEYKSLNNFKDFLKLKFHTNYLYRASQKLSDYAKLIRLHRPIPILLMLWPTLSALFLAARGFPGFKLILIFTLGVFLTRSLGDIVNDLTDKNLDGKITRTKIRPLATGRVSVREALFLIFVFLFLSLFLLLFLNLFCVYLSFIALFLILIYPFMKRVTYLPQVILGLAYNFGIIMAYGAVQQHISLISISWWLLAALWTVAYDTMYALADVKDDLISGIKSTAVLFGSQVLNIISGLQIICFIWAGILGYLLKFNFIYFIFLFFTVFFGVYERFLLKNNLNNACNKIRIKTCITAFNNNHWIGFLIFLGISTQFS